MYVMRKIMVIMLLHGLFARGAQTAHDTIYSLRDLAQYLEHPKTLLVFDIDNTLLTTVTDLGSDQWFTHMVQEHRSCGLEYRAAVEQVAPLYHHIHKHIDLVPTEPCLAQLFASLALDGYAMICLTARSLVLQQKTLEHLTKYELLKFLSKYPDHDTANYAYAQGVIFCAGRDKGVVLLSFLQSVGCEAAIIIFVEDKMHQVDSVLTALRSNNIPSIGLRYAGLDERVQAFNPRTAQQELNEFLMSNPLDKCLYLSES
jgi:hypothetical protein